LEHGGEARRREQHVRRDLAVSEHPPAPRAHVRRGDEELDRCSRQPIEIDDFGKDIAQRICARAHIVRREQARHQVHGDEGRRMVERPAAQQDVERRAPQRAEQRRARYAPPKILQRGAGAVGALVGIAVDQHRGIHRSRRRAGDTVDAQPRLLEQAVEHAPREGAMGAAALQREVHQNGGAGRFHDVRRHRN